MQAYVLGLPDSFRGAGLLDALRELGFDAMLVPGIDGRQLSDAEFASLYDPVGARAVCGRELGRGEVACTLGHLRMFEQMLADGNDWAICFEDDAQLSRDVLDVIPALAKLPAGSIVTLRHDEAGGLVCWPNPAVEGVIRRLIATPMGASAYFIDATAAQTAVAASHGRSVDSAPDWPPHWSTKVRWWVTTKNLSPHSANEPSQLQAGRSVAARSFQAPWGNGGVRDRLGWARRLVVTGLPPLTALRVALLQPGAARVARRIFGTRCSPSGR